MPLLPVWIALSILVITTTAGAIHVFLRVRTFLRSAKRVSAEMRGAVENLEQSVERLSANVEAAESATPRLEASVARLRRSLARLAVLRAALQDTADSFAWLAVVYPRK